MFPDVLLIAFTEAVDYTKFWNELRESLSLVKSGKCTARAASFNHPTTPVHEHEFIQQDRFIYPLANFRILRLHVLAGVRVGHERDWFMADPLDPARGDSTVAAP